jgi:3-phenylpropionate/cinnamic acid dioxygenase small subunit
MREETIREVEQFLYREARLLDERRFHEWLELFTEDVRQRRRSRQIDLLSVTMVGTAISARIAASSRLGGQ